VNVQIDGVWLKFPKGTRMIEACKQAKAEVPHYCYHPKLSSPGNCRMCLVEMGMPPRPAPGTEPEKDEHGMPKIGWMPRPVIACANTVAEGMGIRTESTLTQECRKGVMEFLLINHPLDCPICDQAGECRLQEFSVEHGKGESRFREDKVKKPKNVDIGPRVRLDDERCIMCSRCIRFTAEIADEPVLGFTERGSHTTLAVHTGKRLEHNYSLNTVDICPVGALTSTDFRFKMRVWFLKQTNSIDTESSVGANTVVWSREGVIYRITPRRNDEVNDTWMADSGRELFKPLRASDRLNAVRVNGAASALDLAILAAVDLLKAAAGAVAVVGSGRSSVEEQFLTRRLIGTLQASALLVSRVGEGDKILVSADRNPNVRGALVTGLIRELPQTKLSALGAAIDAGKVKAIVAVGEDLAAAGLSAAQLAKVAIVYLGTQDNATAAAAKVVIPTLSVFEKSGTFVNQQFRLQKFLKCVPAVAGAHDDLVVLTRLIAALGAAPVPAELHALWTVLAAEVPALKAITFANLPETGLLLDATPYAGLPFVEGETLHYKPAAPAAIAAT
jgi:NADH-quinone oxidoreductase subunit G